MPGPVTTRTRAAAKRVRALPPVVVRSGADQIADAVLHQCRSDMGGDGLFSGMPQARRFDVDTRPQSRGKAAQVEVTPTERGVAAILEYGTRRHTVAASRERRSRALRIGNQWITGPVVVRGSPAKHSWSRGVDAGTDAAIAAAGDEFTKAARGT